LISIVNSGAAEKAHAMQAEKQTKGFTDRNLEAVIRRSISDSPVAWRWTARDG
jgi:hypothetical protein